MAAGDDFHDFDALVIRSTNADGIVKAVNAMLPLMPPGLRRRFTIKQLQVLTQFGTHGLFERFNNKSVGSLLREINAKEASNVIESGEIDQVKYFLHEPRDRERDERQ